MYSFPILCPVCSTMGKILSVLVHGKCLEKLEEEIGNSKVSRVCTIPFYLDFKAIWIWYISRGTGLDLVYF